MNWTNLNSLAQIEQIKEESKLNPVLIFKHSTRCATSGIVLSRLERNWQANEMASVTPYYLDLISYRNVSNQIADSLNVEHESPQVLIIRDGIPVYVRSHLDIDFNGIKETIFPKN